jgi:hypothetical protein
LISTKSHKLPCWKFDTLQMKRREKKANINGSTKLMMSAVDEMLHKN